MESNTTMIYRGNVLIFGGSGFIGSNLAEVLACQGYGVISLSRSPQLASDLRGRSIQYVCADASNPATYAEYIELADHIVYLASGTTPGTSSDNPYLDIEANLLPFIQMLKINGMGKRLPVLFASSGGTVYGVPRYLPIDELHPTEPICPYGIVKLAMEKYLMYYARTFGFGHTILRISNPFGGLHHRRMDQGVIDVFARKIIRRENLVIWGEGAVVRDYIHIEDVCHGFAKALTYRGGQSVFNIGSGRGRSILEIVSSLAFHAKVNPEINFARERGHDIRENVLDISSAKLELGWAPQIDFDQGIMLTLRNAS